MASEIELAQHLSVALSFDTVTRRTNDDCHQSFIALFEALAQRFPLTFTTAEVVTVNQYAKVLHFGGLTDARPDLFVFHTDVVPVDQGSIEQWRYPPFSGEIADGAVWGRGALDNKGPMIAFLAALEQLLSDKVAFERPFSVAIGHDEETGGARGAAHINAYFQQTMQQFDCLYDEGTPIMTDLVAQIAAPIGLVSCSEKGFVNLKLEVRGQAGHGALPPEQNCIERLCQVIGEIKAEFATPVDNDEIAKLSFYRDMRQIANAFLSDDDSQRLLNKQFSHHPFFKAQSATTLTVTMLSGGIKQNVLPNKAQAVLHLRLSAGESVNATVARIQSLLQAELATLEVISASEPSRVSSSNCDGFNAISEAIATVFPKARIAEGAMIASSDAAHYPEVATNLYRFIPFELSLADLALLHGVNERVGTKAMVKAMQFYRHLLRRRMVAGREAVCR